MVPWNVQYFIKKEIIIKILNQPSKVMAIFHTDGIIQPMRFRKVSVPGT